MAPRARVVGAAIRESRAEPLPSRAPLHERQIELGVPLLDAAVAVADADRGERMQRPVTRAREAARNVAYAERRRVQHAALPEGREVHLRELLFARSQTRGQRNRSGP